MTCFLLRSAAALAPVAVIGVVLASPAPAAALPGEQEVRLCGDVSQAATPFSQPVQPEDDDFPTAYAWNSMLEWTVTASLPAFPAELGTVTAMRVDPVSQVLSVGYNMQPGTTAEVMARTVAYADVDGVASRSVLDVVIHGGVDPEGTSRQATDTLADARDLVGEDLARLSAGAPAYATSSGRAYFGSDQLHPVAANYGGGPYLPPVCVTYRYVTGSELPDPTPTGTSTEPPAQSPTETTSESTPEATPGGTTPAETSHPSTPATVPGVAGPAPASPSRAEPAGDPSITSLAQTGGVEPALLAASGAATGAGLLALVLRRRRHRSS